MFRKSGKVIITDNMEFRIKNNGRCYNYSISEEFNSNIFNTVMVCIRDIHKEVIFESEGIVYYDKCTNGIYDMYIGEENLTECLLNNENKYIEIEMIIIKNIEEKGITGDNEK